MVCSSMQGGAKCPWNNPWIFWATKIFDQQQKFLLIDRLGQGANVILENHTVSIVISQDDFYRVRSTSHYRVMHARIHARTRTHTHKTHEQAQVCTRSHTPTQTSGQASKQAKGTRSRRQTRKQSDIKTPRSTTTRDSDRRVAMTWHLSMQEE